MGSHFHVKLALPNEKDASKKMEQEFSIDWAHQLVVQSSSSAFSSVHGLIFIHLQAYWPTSGLSVVHCKQPEAAVMQDGLQTDMFEAWLHMAFQLCTASNQTLQCCKMLFKLT